MIHLYICMTYIYIYIYIHTYIHIDRDRERERENNFPVSRPRALAVRGAGADSGRWLVLTPEETSLVWGCLLCTQYFALVYFNVEIHVVVLLYYFD